VSPKAIQAEGIAEANGIQEMNNALARSGGEAIVKLRIVVMIFIWEKRSGTGRGR
jgi:hypothetical protein